MFLQLRKQLNNQRGFTLVELVVVIAILGVLAAIAVPKLSSSTNNARTAKIQADLRTIDSAHAIYNATTGSAIADDTAVDSSSALVPNYLAAAPAPPSGYSGTYVIKGGRGAYKKGNAYQYAETTSFTQ